MSLAHKLYKIGQLVTNEDIKKIIEVTEFKDFGSYTTLQIDFHNDRVTVNQSAVDSSRTMFTKKIGGTSNSYYLYPNFEYQKEKDLYKKFKSIAYTFENSVLLYASEDHKKLAKSVWHYIQNYSEDALGLKSFESGNYFLIVTINGKTLYELMPEILENYLEEFVEPHITKKIKGVSIPQLHETLDFITLKKSMCGYNPNVKFFTMDNYNDKFKPQIINKLPMSKETATAIKKGWMYAITHLKFYHKGLEYLIIPSMINFDSKVYKKLLTFLKKSHDTESLASKEDSFIKRLGKQIEDFDKDKINAISLGILFTEVNLTNLSVKIFATLEDVIPSRIKQVVNKMQQQGINDALKRQANSKDTYLRDYFSRDELFAIATKNTAGMKNKIIQEKIYLAKILLGYTQLKYIDLLKRFEHHREYDFEHNKKLEDDGIKEWMHYTHSFIENENRVIDFLQSINAIENRRSNYE